MRHHDKNLTLMISSINPVNNQKIKTYTPHSKEDIHSIIKANHAAYCTLSNSTLESRIACITSLAEKLNDAKPKLAELMTLEMGKTLHQATQEIEKCIWLCQYYNEQAPSLLEDKHIETDALKSYVSYRPLGSILMIMPWNFPFWQVFRVAVPNILAGNALILKHASNVTGCSMAIEDLFSSIGLPPDSLRSVVLPSDRIEEIISHRYIQGVSLTGSGPAGSSVASLAGKYIKKTVLELGGSDPYIILPDADIELAVSQCVSSRILNAGQSCIGAKRFIIHQDIYDYFSQSFIDKMGDLMVGDPKTNVDLGPLARVDLRDEVHDQVMKCLHLGAELRLGGKIPDMEGAYYVPTVLENILPGMPGYDDEIFGPVASLIKASDEDDAIRIANDTAFGLGAGIFTQDLEKGEHIARYKLNAGSCFVNQYVKSDPRLPFGGIGISGYGRELSTEGMREFVNVKTVYIK